MPIWTLYGMRSGIATTSWPGKENAEVQPGVLGLPRFQADRCQENCRACADVCLPEQLGSKPDKTGNGSHSIMENASDASYARSLVRTMR